MVEVRLAWAPLPPARARRDVAWSLLRDLAPGARITNPCPFCGGPHGPVQLHGVPLVGAVTYTQDLAIVGVSAASVVSRLAIDAERADAACPVELSGESAGVREWVRVEAALKADGRGIRVDPASVTVRDEDQGWCARVPGRGMPIAGRDLDGPDGTVVAAASLPRVTSAPGGGVRRSTR